MLRLKTSQFKLPVRTLTRPTSAARFLRPTGNVTIKTLSTAATVVATQQQKTRYFTNLWKTSAVLATSAITYGLLNNNVLELEAYYSLGDSICQAIVHNDLKALKK
ncbi:hypothetical protein G6F42_026733 [Rhizopus arrhizus]|nr:hypothetical protein G6F42_026733 [Rhizopus arrhizus]